MNQEQFDKVRQYLLDQGQQELVGHLDGFKQEYDGLVKDHAKALDGADDRESAQDFQDRAKQADESGNLPPKPDPNAVGK